MSLQVLAPHQAFQPGSDLWVVGSPLTGAWALKVDWHLHFQIIKAKQLAKPPDSFPEEILSVPHQNHGPLLVVAENYLPCRWVLSLDHPSTELIQSAFTGLRAQRIRAFLNDFSAPQQQELKRGLSEAFKSVELVEESLDESPGR